MEDRRTAPERASTNEGPDDTPEDSKHLEKRLERLEAAQHRHLQVIAGASAVLGTILSVHEDLDTSEGEAGTASPSADRVGELERTVKELRADLEHLRRELATEVRTRRVVVVEPDGFERVVVTGAALPESSGVHVYARAQRGVTPESYERTHVSMYAVEDGWDGQEEVGVSFWGAGNDYGHLSLEREEDVVDDHPSPATWQRWTTSLTLNNQFGGAALVVDADGVKNHPTRLYKEAQARKAEVQNWGSARQAGTT